MDNGVWDQNVELEEDEMYDESPSYGTYIRVNGMNYDVRPGSSFKETVLSYAKDAGLGKFRVFMNGEELGKSSAPSEFNEGTKVELRPYDVAG